MSDDKKNIFDVDNFTNVYNKTLKESLSSMLLNKKIENILRRNTGVIMFAICLLFMYMNNRHKVEMQYRELSDLYTKLEILRYTSIETEAELLLQSRPDKVKSLLQKHGIQLEERRVPAYIIEK